MNERIFISYKRVDKERVFAIKDGIEQATGEKCWIDLDGIECDAQFDHVIINAINRCEVFLFMYSEAHKNIDTKNDWTIREINFARAKGKRIVFINLDNAPLIDWFLLYYANYQQIDATDDKKLEYLYKDLCEWQGITPRTIPQPAHVELPDGEFQVGELRYSASKDSNGIIVCGPIEEDTAEIHIPSQIKYGKYTYNVTSIKSWAFSDCSSLTSITIPNSVTSIGGHAFDGCSSLTSITIPNSLTNFGYAAFVGCSSLASITIPNSITRIGSHAFVGCSSLTFITIPNSVTSIGKYAFYGCSSLTSITIPNSVTSIGEYAFNSCSALTSITIPNSVTSIGERAFCDCSSLTSITIPNSVTSIGGCAFAGCSGLKSMLVECGNTVYDSRENCNAIIEAATNTLIAGCQNTIIPNSVTSIGSRAFLKCTSLTSITIPNSVTSIGYEAFEGCSSLTSITIPNSVTSIGDAAFWDCYRLTSITIPNSVKSIGGEAFKGCSSLTSITIPNSVTSIGDTTFRDCSSLTSITIPNSVTSIGRYAFEGCESLTMLNYAGTKKDWKKIQKEKSWNYNSKIRVIRCTDGKIRLYLFPL